MKAKVIFETTNVIFADNWYDTTNFNKSYPRHDLLENVRVGEIRLIVKQLLVVMTYRRGGAYKRRCLKRFSPNKFVLTFVVA